jgi:dTDP-4-amino-4,6-dideoxygalactose transaminase
MSAATGATVPLLALTRLDPDLLDELRRTFDEVVASGAFTLGEELERFEAEFAAHCGVAECVGASDGTNALRMALEALAAGPGREVITVPHTFVATVEAIAATGARPVLVDIDPLTRCMDPGRLAAAITPRTAAIVPVHLYGRLAPMAEILEAAGQVPVVEDAAQAHGAEQDGRRAGSFGAAASFSFYPTKNLGALGDGGAVVTGDPDLARAVRSLRHHGCTPDDANEHVRPGSTARLDNLQAALLSVKLRRLDAWNEERRAAAERYRRALADLPVRLPAEDEPGGRQVYHLFAVEVENRDAVREALRERGIAAGVHYPTPVHLQPAWSGLGYSAGDFPASERAAASVLSLPIFPGITGDEIELVIAALRDAVAA